MVRLLSVFERAAEVFNQFWRVNLDRQARLKSLTSWMMATILVNCLWVVSFVVRHLVHSVDQTTQENPTPRLWLLWLSIDAVWILISHSLVAIMTQKDDITEHTSDLIKPTALVYMGDAAGGQASSIFLNNFSEEQVQLSLSSEQPIFRRIPQSWGELIQWPHPINETQNRMHAGLISLVHLPISILLINYANFPWYLVAVLISVFLRFAFAYRFEPQSWLVLYVSKIFEPQWAPGAPKRYSTDCDRNFYIDILTVCCFGSDLRRSCQFACCSLPQRSPALITRPSHRGYCAVISY
jgi:hypothetical protein